jgi:hypothetical protein
MGVKMQKRPDIFCLVKINLAAQLSIVGNDDAAAGLGKKIVLCG